MPTSYSSHTVGPWLLDDDNVVLDGFADATYIMGLPTLDGTFPNPIAALIAIGVEKVLAGRGIYVPSEVASGKATTYPVHGSPMTYTATGVIE